MYILEPGFDRYLIYWQQPGSPKVPNILRELEGQGTSIPRNMIHTVDGRNPAPVDK